MNIITGEKGLLVWVYRGLGGDCTNGGISSAYDRLILVGDGVPEIFESDSKAPAVRLIKREVFGKKLIQCTDAEKGFGMFGGNFIYSCDSRFPSDSPIKIMDRYEN